MVNFVVVGAGRISLSHIPHIMANSSSNLVAIVEPNILLRFIFKTLLNVPVKKSIHQLEGIKYDAVLVLTPPTSHFAICTDFLLKDKHVFLEKPMTLESRQSQALLALAKDRSLQLSVGYVYRYQPIYMKLKELLQDKTYGAATSLLIEMKGNVVKADSPSTWRTKGVGSGCLYDYGCHAIDLSLFLMGTSSSVSCISKVCLFNEGSIDRFEVEILHKGELKRPSRIKCDWSDATVRKASLNICVLTESNKIACDGQKIQVTGHQSEVITIKDVDTSVDYYLRGEEFQNQLSSFITSIVTNKTEYYDVEQAVEVDHLLESIYREVI
jgi:scyllo-inositol 2-dehydrogenase (NADP+)|tara:strand:+ start:13899 stop:14876 length:978 start_codon:yes stop_codon:yes gene_type:complete